MVELVKSSIEYSLILLQTEDPDLPPFLTNLSPFPVAQNPLACSVLHSVEGVPYFFTTLLTLQGSGIPGFHGSAPWNLA